LFVQFLAEQPVQMALSTTPAGLIFSSSQPASVESNSVAEKPPIEIINSISTSNRVPLSSTNVRDSLENIDQLCKSIESEATDSNSENKSEDQLEPFPSSSIGKPSVNASISTKRKKRKISG
jgi:hypothetical protein